MTILTWGRFTAAGKYKLADAAYSELLHKLQGHYTEMPPELRSDILAFYHDLGGPMRPRRTLAIGPGYSKISEVLQPVDDGTVSRSFRSGTRSSRSYGHLHRAAGGSWSVGIPARAR